MVPTPMPNDPLNSERELAGQIDAVRDLPSLVRADARVTDAVEAAAALVGGTRRVRLVGSGEAGDIAEIASWCFRAIGLAAVHDHPHDLINQPSGLDPGDVVVMISTGDPTSVEQQVFRRASSTGINTVGVLPAGTDDDLEFTVRVELAAPRPVILISAALVLARIAATLEAGSDHASAVSALEGRLNDLDSSAAASGDDVFARYSADSSRILICGSGPLVGVASAMARLLRETRGYWSLPVHVEDVQLSELHWMRDGDLLVELTGQGESADLHERIAEVAAQRGVDRFQIGTAIAEPQHHFHLDADLSPAGAIVTLAATQYAVLGTLTAEAVG